MPCCDAMPCTCSASSRNSRDTDLLASTYRGLAEARKVEAPGVHLAQPVMVMNIRQGIGKKVVATVMMSIAMAIALTLVWHVTESEHAVEWRRAQHDVAHSAQRDIENHSVDRRRNEGPHRDRGHDDTSSLRLEGAPKMKSGADEKTLIRRTGHTGASKRRKVKLPPIPNLARMLGEDGKSAKEIPQPKLYEAPKEPPSVEQLLSPWSEADSDLIFDAPKSMGPRTDSVVKQAGASLQTTFLLLNSTGPVDQQLDKTPGLKLLQNHASRRVKSDDSIAQKILIDTLGTKATKTKGLGKFSERQFSELLASDDALQTEVKEQLHAFRSERLMKLRDIIRQTTMAASEQQKSVLNKLQNTSDLDLSNLSLSLR